MICGNVYIPAECVASHADGAGIDDWAYLSAFHKK